MQKKWIIKSKVEFNSVFKNSDQIFTKFFIFKYIKNESFFRYGISVPKKNFKLAVHRNKIKRQIKYILNSIEINKKIDLILIVRKDYTINNFQNIRNDFLKGIKKIIGGYNAN